MAPQLIPKFLSRHVNLAQHNFTSNDNSDRPTPSLRHASFSVYIALAIIIFLTTGVLLYAIHSCYVSAIYHANIRLAGERLETHGRVSNAKWKSRSKKANRSSLKQLLLQPGSTSSESLLRSSRPTSRQSYSSRSGSFESPQLPINYPTPRLDIWPSNRKSNPFTVANMNGSDGAGGATGQCHGPRTSSGELLNLPKKCYDPKERVTPVPVSDRENVDPYRNCDSGQAKVNARRSLGWGSVRKSIR